MTERQGDGGREMGLSQMTPSFLTLAQLDAEGRSHELRVTGSETSRSRATGAAGEIVFPTCANTIAELAEARVQLVDDGAQETWALNRIFAEARARRQQSRRRWLPLAFLPLAAAATFALVLSTSVSDPARLPSSAVQAPQIRSKGALLLETFYRRGEMVALAEDGAPFLQGDRLRFRYTLAEDGHIAIFSVDDRGQVFPFYPASALGSQLAAAGAQVMLPGSIELDGHKGWERVYAVWSPEPLPGELLRSAVAEAYAGASGDLTKMDDLAAGAHQASLLMRRQ